MKRRYKILCDNIFLHATEEPLRKSNMNKLLFYSISHAEKLDRIGRYLLLLQKKHVSRNKKSLVMIGVETFDQLMTSRAGHTVLITESYLKMLCVLLEMKDLYFFELVVESFWRFSQIRDDTIAYRGNLNFLVDRFCAFSFVGVKSEDDFTRYRLASLKGIKGIICKGGNDNLQLSIYSSEYISQIIPVIFFNLFPPILDSCSPKKISVSEKVYMLVRGEAEDCLRNLLSRATYSSSVSTIVQIALRDYDTHLLWTIDSPLGIKYFKLMICSFPLPHADVVVTLTLNHLSKHESSPTETRIGICRVLKGIIQVLSKNYMSESILDLVSRILNHMDKSLNGPQNKSEKEYQLILSKIMVNFAANLSTCQRVEVMDYIISRLPFGGANTQQVILLLETVEEISQNTEPGLSVQSQFPSSYFLDNLLGLSISEDPAIRLKTQAILQGLFDRRNIRSNIPNFRDSLSLDSTSLVKPVEADRQDNAFMTKNGIAFFMHLQASAVLPTNSLAHFEQLYRTIVLIDLHFSNNLIDVVRLLIHIQNVQSEEPLDLSITCQIHALVASVFMFASRSREHSRLTEYVDDIIRLRGTLTPYLLPEWFYVNESVNDVCEDFQPYLFDSERIKACLEGIEGNEELLRPFNVDLSQCGMTNLDVLDTQSGSFDIALINLSRNDSLEKIKFDTFRRIKESTIEIAAPENPQVEDKLLLRPIMETNSTVPISIPSDMSDIYIEMK